MTRRKLVTLLTSCSTVLVPSLLIAQLPLPECLAMITAGAPASAAPLRASPDQAPCGAMRVATGTARAAGVPLARLVQMLSQFTGRPVNDTTGLTGLYDFTLKFNPNLNVDSAADSDVPHLFTALPEQLGLRLEPETRLLLS